MTRSRLVVRVLEQAVVPLGAALAAGALVAALVPPQWTAPGLPFFLGHAKNVESPAVVAGLAAAVAATLLGPRRPPILLAAVAGFAVLIARGHLRALAAAWLPLLLGLAAPLFLGATRRADPARTDALPRALGAALVALLACVAFVLGSEPLVLDVFHHGEVLASALDLLHGGVPFKSFIWPHGVHDTGLAALWITVTDKVGTSPVALARASCRALGVVAGYVLARRLLGGRAAAVGVAAVMALLPLHGALPGPAECPDAVQQLGILAFVILAFVALGSRSRAGTALAGAFLACGYLFRIETAIYGAAASVALVATRVLAKEPAGKGGAAADEARTHGWRVAVADLARAYGALALGAVAVLAASRLVLGWPDGAWLDYTLRELPRHHRDAVGLPFPWPLRDGLASHALPHQPAALAWLAFMLALGVQTARGVAARGASRETLVFVVTFALLATRSSLERSDGAHLLQWAALPLVAVVLLLVERTRVAGWPAPLRAAFLVVALLWIDGPALRAAPFLASPAALAATATERWRAAAEHLAPNAPVGACRDTTMTSGEAKRPENARFLGAVCDLEILLRSHGATALVVAHSAPWYHVRLGMPPPSRFFAFARAYTPAAQLALVDDLRAARPTALLRARGFAALEIFDVADAVRVPVVDAYLRARVGGVAPHATPVGDVFFWNEEAPPTYAHEPEASVDEAVDYPDAGRRLLFRWTTDPAGRWPLVGPMARDEAELGWIAADGRAGRTVPPAPRERTLPLLTGAEWRDLARAVERASALGRADRERALRPDASAAPTGPRRDER